MQRATEWRPEPGEIYAVRHHNGGVPRRPGVKASGHPHPQLGVRFRRAHSPWQPCQEFGYRAMLPPQLCETLVDLDHHTDEGKRYHDTSSEPNRPRRPCRRTGYHFRQEQEDSISHLSNIADDEHTQNEEDSVEYKAPHTHLRRDTRSDLDRFGIFHPIPTHPPTVLAISLIRPTSVSCDVVHSHRRPYLQTDVEAARVPGSRPRCSAAHGCRRPAAVLQPHRLREDPGAFGEHRHGLAAGGVDGPVPETRPRRRT